MEFSPFDKKNTLSNVAKSADTINQFLTPLNKGLLSDSCNETMKATQSSKSGYYRLHDRTMTNQDCYMDYQNVGGNGKPIKDTVDLESELRGITRINSNCDNNQLKKASILNLKSNTQDFKYCNGQLAPTDTRQRKSCKSTSEVLLDRFDFPLDNFNVQPNSYIGLNTRIESKKQLEKEDLKMLGKLKTSKKSNKKLCNCGKMALEHTELQCSYIN